MQYASSKYRISTIGKTRALFFFSIKIKHHVSDMQLTRTTGTVEPFEEEEECVEK